MQDFTEKLPFDVSWIAKPVQQFHDRLGLEYYVVPAILVLLGLAWLASRVIHRTRAHKRSRVDQIAKEEASKLIGGDEKSYGTAEDSHGVRRSLRLRNKRREQ
ncbi:MAG: hypothetical protein MHM6MM_002582 [Cercozoa sp. M6MM]